MAPCPDRHVLQDLLDDAPEPGTTELMNHLDTCISCQHTLQMLAAAPAFWSKLPDHLPKQGFSESGLDRAIEHLQADGADSHLNRAQARLPADFLVRSDLQGHLGRIGHYEVVRVLGQGGMGVVLEARDTKLQRMVALKVLAPELARHPTARQRFVREAQTAAAVHHQYVVALHAVEEAQGLPYLVMEHVDGISLQELIDREGPLPIDEVLHIGIQVAEGLAAAHAQGLVHRDIKPSNILLDSWLPTHTAKIADFGLAQAVDEPRLTKDGWLAGTPEYMSPEQARNEPADPRSDLFSFGSVMYATCTGRPPFSASTSLGVLKQLADEPTPDVRHMRPDVPVELAQVIARLHAKNPAQRFQAASEVAELLRQIAAHRQDPSQPRPEILPPAKRAVCQSWLIAAGLLAALIGGLAVCEAVGVTQLLQAVIRIVTPDGILVVEVDDPAVKVTVENGGKEVVITGPALRELRVRPGPHKLQATRDGKPIALPEDIVVISSGVKRVVKISRETPRELSAAEKLDRAKKIWDEASVRHQQAIPLRNSDPWEAERLLRGALELYETLARDYPGVRKYSEQVQQSRFALKTTLHVQIHIIVFNAKSSAEEVERAVRVGKEAVQLGPDDNGAWAGLGRSYYRAKDWQAAKEALQKSFDLGNKRPHDDFFMAMTHWQLDEKEQARKRYDQGVEWLNNNPRADRDAERIRAEAAALLGVAKQ